MDEKDTSYFKKLLQSQKAEILQGAGKAANQGDLNVIEDELYDTVDRSSVETDRNFTLRLLDRDRKLIKKIDDALARLENGEFGLCDECGCEISVERLKARPVANLCIECKEAQERKEQMK